MMTSTVIGRIGHGLAAGLVFLLAGCGDPQVPMEDAQKYHDSVADRYRLLGQSIILQGRLLESFSLDNDVLDQDHFRGAEEILAAHLGKIGTVEEIEAMPLSHADLKPMHKRFSDAVYFIRESANAVDEGAYGPESIAMAEESWKRARRSYVDFTEQLLVATGEESQLVTDGDDDPSNAAGTITRYDEKGDPIDTLRLLTP